MRRNVLGGTAWLWARPEFAGAVDVLFVDEAGQMSLANVLAVSGAAKSIVLLGDPQQLDQPQKGSHPDGVNVSALEHILGAHQTIPPERGIFLPVTWRMAPSICRFTSELFYEGKLTSKPGLERQALVGVDGLDGSGLVVVEVEHDGNRNASDEEVEVVAELVARLLAPGARWTDEKGVAAQLTGRRRPGRGAVQRAGQPARGAPGAHGRARRAPWTSSRGRRRPSSSTRWRRRRPRTRRAGWSSCTA